MGAIFPTSGYLHGYQPEEQSRLFLQSRIVEAQVFSGVKYPSQGHILEIGCGVGAQTEILLELIPNARFTSIDVSEVQIERAKQHFFDKSQKDQVRWLVADATQLPFENETFDGAFLCWVLEHTSQPLQVLTEIRRCLKPGTKIFCSEVMNQLSYIYPESEAIRNYWTHYNSQQCRLGGDPFIGAKLPYLLQQSGFNEIEISSEGIFADCRDNKQRSQKIQFIRSLLMSGAAELLKSRKVDETLINQVHLDLNKIDSTPDGACYLGWIRASATA